MVRASCEFTTMGDPFLLKDKSKSYQNQFANIYFMRLNALRKGVIAHAAERWNQTDAKHVRRVLDVQKGERSYIVGTVYMEMRLKPNVLDDIGKDHNVIATTIRDKIWSEDDALMLEDESGRIKLVGSVLEKHRIVTGVIMAALGCENAYGEFEVADLCFTEPAPRMTPQTDAMDVDGDGSLVAFVSGFDFGPETTDSEMPQELLLEYLSSDAGHLDDFSGRISRLVIVGNSIAPPDDEDENNTDDEAVEAELNEEPEPEKLHEPVLLRFGELLMDLCRELPVHLMPGPTDPTGSAIPQQPIPGSMFGDVNLSQNLRCETNPSLFSFDGQGVLVISGQNIDDMCKYFPEPRVDRLGMAGDTLRWRHIAPTAPDTLWCYPYFDRDPFALKESPHVYVIGNQPDYRTELVADEDGDPVRIVLVPSFAKTQTIVMLNTKTLEVTPVMFKMAGWKL
ncbi:DNA polymerase alpha/epsilon subunit B-domain-containing protein [Auriculariales sp. MPI-PUGE-AT-0066]|nr:DNA polymerase alpha/epsilon subunit B-domain-containing protein [Auriculariales sp. MPI-PUGE-AT-0066]